MAQLKPNECIKLVHRVGRRTGRLKISLKLQHAAIVCALILLLTLTGAQADDQENQQQVQKRQYKDKTEIKGWTEVNDRWPLKEPEFFIAVLKNHHYIEVKLPPKINSDLKIKLEYYYKFKTVRPTFQIVPCDTNIDILSNENSHGQNPPGRWLTHEMEVKKSDCDRRRDLAYHVLLHDENDIFAWRLLEISGTDNQGNEQVQSTTPGKESTEEIPTTIATAITTTTTTTATAITTTTTGQSSISEEPTSEGLAAEITTTTGYFEQSSTEPTTTSRAETTTLNTLEEAFDVFHRTSTSETPRQKEGEDEQEIGTITTTPQAPTQQQDSQSSESHNEDKDWSQLARRSSTSKKSSHNRRNKRFVMGDNEDNEGNEGTTTATTATTRQQVERVKIICKPSSCDKSLIKWPRFMTFAKGLPKLPNAGPLSKEKKFYIDTHSKPLNIIQESSEDFSQVNPCVELELYMDPGTELEFLVANSSSPSAFNNSLELIRRRVGDSGASKWETFKRCISDYMPKLNTVGPHSHQLRFTFVPKSGPGKQVAILADSRKAVSVHELYPPHEYMPNALDPQLIVSDDELSKYWILDGDGVEKANFKFDTLSSTTSGDGATSGGNGERVLRITNIDPTQEHFDITSRWLKVSDMDSIDNRLFFNYRADPADWVSELEFQFQRSSWAADTWASQRALPVISESSSNYPTEASTIAPETSSQTSVPISATTIASSPSTSQAPVTASQASESTSPPYSTSEAPVSSSTLSPSTESSTSETLTSSPVPFTTSEVPTISTAATSTQANPLVLPIRIRGLSSSEEFRLRVRHYLKQQNPSKDGATSQLKPYELVVRTLAFGDACAGPMATPYCLNGGKCRPTGTASAECTCLPGYSGVHCQVVKPCEVYYGDKTGEQLCAVMGAVCVKNLPVLRCQWPTDQFYECRALYQYDNSTNEVVPLPPASDQARPEAVEADEVGTRQRQAKTIIVLTVFMVALLLFSVVIIGNMIRKLIESKRRLKRAESEVHELTRRSQPGTSTSSFGRLTGRNKPPATLSYNNPSFDAQ